ncbi:hypothetical protein [Marinobacter algicola]|uniref:hypothetical protein n=1 Tax=Marinobacter algicola TaxID=236100 RepID=UPI003BA8C092
MNLGPFIPVTLTFLLIAPPLAAEVSLAPFAGFRMSSSVDIETAGASTSDQIDFRDSARLDLRGVYTALNSGGSAFCSGGCELRFDSSGYLQVEAAAGLAIRF